MRPTDAAASPRSPTAIVGAAACAGAVVTLAALAALVSRPPAADWVLGSLALLAAATAAEAFPLPLVGLSRGVSVAASFIVGAAVVYDWRSATLLGVGCRLVVEIVRRRPPRRLLFDTAAYALAAAAAGGAAALPGEPGSAATLVGSVAAAAAAFYATNLVLVAVLVARATGTRVVDVVEEGARWTILPVAIMASVTLMLVVLWTRAPPLSLALAGPLLAVILYQRSLHRSLEAMRLAKTDPLTNLGNHRAFDERIAELIAAGTPFTLCLIDLDGFKQVNDRHGHQAGDAVLAAVASQVARAGAGYRLGGDELAVVLLTDAPAQAAQALCDAVAATTHPVPVCSTVSVGYARFPSDGLDRERLLACADAALYHAKRLGRNRVCAYEVRAVETSVPAGAHRTVHARALWQLTEIVDAVDAEEGRGVGHSQRVADLAVALARRLGADDDETELVRLAARLHDLGKLTVPVEILSKSGALADVEWRVVREHPEIGRRILASLGAGEVADWVLHQHEWWDGRGYPAGLAGEAIPRASRIIFVADAFDAMTSDRPFRAALRVDAALHEMRRCAGTQFDPEVVAALLEIVGVEPRPATAAG